MRFITQRKYRRQTLSIKSVNLMLVLGVEI